jgi:serine/threonine-protein kinase
MFTPAPGTVIAGKYRVERTLGAGGVGVVLAAKHLELGQTVAIKVLLPHMVADEDVVSRFSREGKLAAKVASEHVARVLDVDRAADGTPFLVMEYLEGRDLMALAKSRGPLSVEEASEYVLQACDAVAFAHSVGVVHRDLKPANLFLTERPDGSPCVKVLDFGISKEVGGTQDGHTTGFMGSPAYMSPEQMNSPRDVDGRTDIWSLGAILFRLVAGRTPYEAENVVQLAVLMTRTPPTALRTLRPDVPKTFEAVVMRCLSRSVEKRFASVAELASALQPFVPPRARWLVERIARVGAGMPRAPSLVEPPPASEPAIEEPAPASRDATLAYDQGGTLLTQTRDAVVPMTSSRRIVLATVAGALVLASIGATFVFARGGAAPAIEREHAVAPAAASSAAGIAPSAPLGEADSSIAVFGAPPAISSYGAPPAAAPFAQAQEPLSARPRAPAKSPRPSHVLATDGGPSDPWGWQR